MQILFLRKFEFSKVKEIRNENVRTCFQNIGNRLDETEKHKPPIWNSSNIWTKNEYFSNLMFLLYDLVFSVTKKKYDFSD